MQDIANETPALGRDRFGPTGRLLLVLSKYLAIAGGLVFMGLVVMSIVSIVGRKLFSWPVPGDVEVLQMCSPSRAASFLRHCHLVKGDSRWISSPTISRREDRRGSMPWVHLLVGVFGALLAWRTAVGALALKEVGENLGDPGWPVWVAQALDGAGIRAPRRFRVLPLLPPAAGRRAGRETVTVSKSASSSSASCWR